MNAVWKRRFVLVTGILVVTTCVASSAWEFFEMYKGGTAGLVFVEGQGRTNQAPRSWPIGPGAVIRVVPGSPAEKAGILPGDRIISVNGISIFEYRKLIALESTTLRHDVLLYRLQRGESEITTQLRVEPLLVSTAWLATTATQVTVGLVFVCVGLLVFWRKTGDRRSFVFFGCR